MPEYRHLWLGMIAMMGATNMQMIARSQLAWDLTRSPLAVGLVGAGFAPTILIFSLLGGAFADRVNKTRIIQAGQLASLGISVFIGLSLLTDTVTIYHLIGASMAQGMFWAFFMPARQAIIPQLVGKRLSMNGIALNATGMSLMTMVAPGIGGIIYWQFGPAATYFTVSGLYLLAGILSLKIPSIPAEIIDKPRSVLADMCDGLKYIRRNSTVRILLIMALFTALLAMPFRNLLPVYVDELFGRGPEAVGLMMSLMGAGALAGSLFIAGIPPGRGRGVVLIGASTISSLALMAAAGATAYGISIAAMLLLGIGDSGHRSLNSALIMEQSDDRHRGRVMGIYMMNFGLMPAGLIPFGAIAQATNIRWAVLGEGALLLIVCVALLTLTSRVRRL